MNVLDRGALEKDLADLLARWQELRDEGRPAEVDELCRACPELAGPLRERVAAVRAMEAALGVAPGATPTWVEGNGACPGAPPDLPGYEGLTEVARGGMGVVYRARNVRLGRVEAVKLLLAGAQAGPERLARFRTEVGAVARLRHSNVVPVYSVGEWAGQPYFTMEYLEGGSLADRLARGPLPAREAAALVRTLADAVQHAHEQGIVHRDLKPANVLLAPPAKPQAAEERGAACGLAVPKVADFGLAKVLEEGGEGLTRSGAILGTPSYLAPEQALGRAGDVGPAADVYALGTILYECLTGRPPFQGESTLDTLEQVRRREPVAPRQLRPKVERDLETVCLKCLRKEPGKRYASARELADDLGRFLEGRPVLARPVPLRERAVKWARRQPALAALLAVSVLAAGALVGTGAGFTYRLKEERDLAFKAEAQARLAEAEARAEKEKARAAEQKAREEEAKAQKQKGIAEQERDRAKRQSKRAEVLLARCQSVIHTNALATRAAKKASDRPGAVLYALAQFYADAAKQMLADSDLPEADRKRMADQYIISAVKLLECSRDSGHFEDRANVAKLAHDERLKAVWSSPEFQQLRKELRAQLPKGK
jgi:serine/threonine-protein kinase